MYDIQSGADLVYRIIQTKGVRMKKKVRCANGDCTKYVNVETVEVFAQCPEYCCRECEIAGQKLIASQLEEQSCKDFQRNRTGDLSFTFLSGAW